MLNLDHTNRDREMFDLQETAELLGLTVPQVRKEINQDHLIGEKVAGHWWVTRKSMENYPKWQKRMARYDELKALDKQALLVRLDSLQKIHGMSLADQKLDILTAVLDLECPAPKN